MIVACIPAYNEEKYIARVVLGARKHTDMVIVCDDGSEDMTSDIARSLGAIVVRHEKRLGKGAALRSLFEASRREGAKVIVTLDGDGQHDPAEIPEIVRPILEDGVDISIGARFSGKNHIPQYRLIGNRIISKLTNVGAQQKIVDATSGFRAYSFRAVEEMDVRNDGMGADSQILLDARGKQLKIVETQVSVKYGSDTSTFNPVRQFGMILMTLVKYASDEHPLSVLGFPGLVVLGFGLTYGAVQLDAFSSNGIFNLWSALLVVSAVILGFSAVIISIVLFAMKKVLTRFEWKLEHDSVEARTH